MSGRFAAAIGFRVKSGRATAVLLAGPAARPQVVDRRTIALSDPAIPASRQPYHAGFGTAQADARVVARLVRVVTRCTQRSMTTLLGDYRRAGARPRAVGLVVGSTVDPATITNPHIRAHAAEGRLFRTSVEDAARRRRLGATVVREQDVYAALGRALRRGVPAARRAVAALGRDLGSPWTANEKTATAAAWLVLLAPARRSPTR